mmetsp:Transcript_10515/g.28063  ORF Transcript_10515/g.28063 Transcript_10515/m.28063 type:complete len:886 (+) Transcript_10515:1031-3688(+)
MELRDAVVADVKCLQPLQPADADAHVGALDHVAVVGAVADGQRDRLPHALDEEDDGPLLLGRDAAADDRPAHHRDVDKGQLVIRLERELEALAIDHEALQHLPRAVGLPRLLRVLVQPLAHHLRLEDALHLELVRREDRPVLPFVGARLQQAGRDTDDHRGLDLVACEHPDLDACRYQACDRVPDLVLQPVLDAREPVQLEVALDLLGHLVEAVLPVLGGTGGLLELCQPRVQLLAREVAPGQAERAEAVLAEVLEDLQGPADDRRVLQPGEEPLHDHRVGALRVDGLLGPDRPVRAGDLEAAHDRGPLSGRCELEDREHRDLQKGAVVQLHHHAVGGAALEDEAEVLRPVAQSRLVRAAGRVGQLPVGLVKVRHHLVVDRQVQHQVVDRLVLRAAAAAEQLVELVIGQVHVRRFPCVRVEDRGLRNHLPHLHHHVPLDLSHALAVDCPVHAEFAEVHHVARESARLVGEHVLDLPHLLVEVGRPGHAADVLVDHVLVSVHEVDLEKLDEGHGDQQRDRDEVGEEDDEVEVARHEDENHGPLGIALLVSQVQVRPVVVGAAGVEDGADEGGDEAQGALDQEDGACELAGGALEVRHLPALLVLAVHHDLCFLAGVDHDSDGPGNVLDLAPAEEHGLLVDRNLRLLVALGDVQEADEVVEELVGALAVDVALEPRRARHGPVGVGVAVLPDHAEDLAGGRLRLEVGLSVEVGRLDEDVALLVGAREDDHVRGDVLVVLDEHQVSDPQLAPRHCLGWRALGHAVVLEPVGLLAAPVLDPVLEGVQGDDEEEREADRRDSACGAGLGDDLQDHEEEVVGVGRLRELLEQVLGDEVGRRVVRGDDLVVAELQAIAAEVHVAIVRFRPCCRGGHLRILSPGPSMRGGPCG